MPTGGWQAAHDELQFLETPSIEFPSRTSNTTHPGPTLGDPLGSRLLVRREPLALTPSVTAQEDTAGSIVGSVYRRDLSGGYIFQCNNTACNNVRFNRWHDLERHDNTFHNGISVLWCPNAECNRSKGPGHKPFPKIRKDKLKEHVRKMHGFEYEG